MHEMVCTKNIEKHTHQICAMIKSLSMFFCPLLIVIWSIDNFLFVFTLDSQHRFKISSLYRAAHIDASISPIFSPILCMFVCVRINKTDIPVTFQPCNAVSVCVEIVEQATEGIKTKTNPTPTLLGTHRHWPIYS